MFDFWLFEECFRKKGCILYNIFRGLRLELEIQILQQKESVQSISIPMQPSTPKQQPNWTQQHSNSSQQQSLLSRLNQQSTLLSKTFQQQKLKKSSLSKRLRQLLQQRQFYTNEKAVQQRKYKSLNLLVNELQSGYEKLCVQMRSREFIVEKDEQGKVVLENHLLREELIKLNQNLKEDEKLYQFMKQLQINKSTLASFIKRSNFIQQQSQSIAQLRSSISTLQNTNLQCRRKWHLLSRQKQKQQHDIKLYKLQGQRQAQLIRTLYEQYLEKVNLAKTKIVNFNDTRREKLLTQYMVHQVALIQQDRSQLQNENKNLHYHLEQLLTEHQKITLENTQLNSFFINSNRQQQSRLTTKMKQRIEELKDGLLQMQARNSLMSVVNKRNSNLAYVRQKLSKYKEANDFMEIKQQNINDGNFSSLDEKEISQFFSTIIKQKDQKCQMIKQRNQQMNVEIKEMAMRMLLLENQVGNLEEIVKENSIENQFKRKEMQTAMDY